MKLQSASKKEISRIAKGVVVCDVIMIAGLFLLSQFDIGTFSLKRILLGALGGSVIAIANFTIMCLTVQKAVEIEDKKKMKAFFQGSYNGRLLFQSAWVVAALMIPGIHTLAAAAPILFPNAVIFYLQAKGKLVTPSERKNPPQEEDAESEDHLESFEI